MARIGHRIGFSLALAGICLFATCSRDTPGAGTAGRSPGVSADKILIGSSSAKSGPASFLGLQLVQGSLAYLNDLNKAGGVHGRRIELLSYDDVYDPATAAANTKRLIYEDQVFALLDYVGTPTARASLPHINNAKIPVIGLFTGAEFLRTPFQPYVFNIRASYFDEAETIVDYWVSKGRTRIAVFLQDDTFGSAVLSGVELALSRHKLSVAATAKFQRGGKPTPEEVAKIVQINPDAVVMVGTYVPLVQFLDMARMAGLNKTEFHTVSFVGSEAFARELVAAGHGNESDVIVTQVVPSPRGSSAAAAEFRASYLRHYPGGLPNYVAMEGYLNAKVLVEAVKRAGPDLSRESFVRALESMGDFDAGTGVPSQMSADHHSFFDSVFISRMKDGQFEITGQ